MGAIPRLIDDGDPASIPAPADYFGEVSCYSGVVPCLSGHVDGHRLNVFRWFLHVDSPRRNENEPDPLVIVGGRDAVFGR